MLSCLQLQVMLKRLSLFFLGAIYKVKFLERARRLGLVVGVAYVVNCFPIGVNAAPINNNYSALIRLTKLSGYFSINVRLN